MKSRKITTTLDPDVSPFSWTSSRAASVIDFGRTRATKRTVVDLSGETKADMLEFRSRLESAGHNEVPPPDVATTGSA